MIRRALLLVGLAIVGVLVAAAIGYAAYLVSKDSVGSPVTKLETPAERIAPAESRRARDLPPTSSTGTSTARPVPPVTPPPTVTTGDEDDDDNSGRGRGRGRGGGESGSSGSGGSSGGGSGGSSGGDDDD